MREIYIKGKIQWDKLIKKEREIKECEREREERDTDTEKKRKKEWVHKIEKKYNEIT